MHEHYIMLCGICNRSKCLINLNKLVHKISTSSQAQIVILDADVYRLGLFWLDVVGQTLAVLWHLVL